MQAQSADGVLHDFPDGTDPSVVDRVMKDYAQNSAPAQAQGAREAAARRAPRPGRDVPQYGREAPSSTWGDIGNVVGRIAPQANDALASTVGRALDVAPYYISKFLGGEGVHPVESTWKGAFGTKQTGIVPGMPEATLPPPSSGAQELADAGGKMIGETVPHIAAGAAGLPKVAAPVIDAAPSIANAFRSLFNQMGQRTVQKPVATMVGETAAAGESGAIGEHLRSVAEQNNHSPLVQKGAEVVGQTFGPAAVQAMPMAIAAKLAKPAVNASKAVVERGIEATGNAIPENMRPGFVDRLAKQGDEKRATAARGAVAEKLGPALARPEAQAGMAEVETLQNQIPGFKPGVARATNDPELLNTQQSLDTAATGDKLRAKQQGYDESRGAIAQRLENMVPPTTANPEDAAVGAAGRRVGNIGQRIGQQRDAAEGRIREMSDSLPEVDRIGAGGAMRQAREGAQRATDMETTRLRGQIANPGMVVEVQPATETAEAVTMTINQVLNRRASINQEMRDYTDATARTTQDVARMRRLAAERDHLDGVIETAAGTDEGLRAYTTHYRETNVPQFRQGASAEVGRRDQFGYGGNRVDPEQVGKKFFNPNEESAARQFNTAMAHDPAARQQMIDNALDDIRHTTVDPATGLLREGAVGRWVQKHERVLREVPFVREAVDARNPDALYARIGQLEQRQRQVAQTKLARELESISGPGKSSDNAINTALNDHVLMRQLMNSTRNDPAAQAAVRRSVFDALREKAPDAIDNPTKFMEVLRGHDRALSVALTPQHRADLTAIARAAEIQNRLGRPEGTSVVPKSIVGTIQDALGITVGSAASTARGVAQGRTSLPIEAAAQGAKFANRQAKNASDAAWEEALSNPEAAKQVAAVVRGKPTGAQIQKLRAYLLASGVMHAEGRDNAPE